jgi:integrase
VESVETAEVVMEQNRVVGDYGDGFVYQRGKRWWIGYSHEGKAYREPGGPNGKGAKTADEAKKKLKARLREIWGDRFVGPNEERVTIDELLDDLIRHLELKSAKSIASVKSHLKPVRAFFVGDKAYRVTADRIEAFIRQQQERTDDAGRPDPYSNAAINRQTGALRQAFRLAARKRKMSRVPYIPMLVEDNARQGFVEPAAFEVLASKLPEPIDDIARFAYLSGWRKEQILSIRWDQVNRTAREVRPESQARNKRTPALPLAGGLWDVIERRWKARRFLVLDEMGRETGVTQISEFVFHSGQGARVVDLRKSWATAAKAAGLPKVLFHDLRRSAVRNMIRAGVPQSVAMRISGHRTTAMFNRYDITSDTDKREALARVEEWAKGAPAKADGGEKL